MFCEKNCWFSETPFYEEKKLNNKIRNPCQVTGKYRGAANTYWNLAVKQSDWSFITKTLHNYYSHLIIKNSIKWKHLNVPFKIIQQTVERYISIFFSQLGITDSMNFMELELDTIVKALDLGDFARF